MDTRMLALLPAWYVLFLLAITLHEGAHALVAHWQKDPTAYHHGLLTFNPLPHIQRSPMGMVLVPLLSYFLLYRPEIGGWMIGWASVPVNAQWTLNHPRRAALVSAAGPTTNLTLATLGFVGMWIGLAAGAFIQPGAGEWRLDNIVRAVSGEGPAQAAAACLSILFTLNLVLGFFNLIPLPPMDGSSIVPAFLPRGWAYRYQSTLGNPQYAFLGLIIAWYIAPKMLGLVLSFFLRLLYFGGF